MYTITRWMEDFTHAWKTCDIGTVLQLFTDDVEYWETPFVRVSDKQKLRQEWEYIKQQQNIQLTYDIFSAENQKYCVTWELKYTNVTTMEPRHLRGIYLIRLNTEEKCDYFLQCGELE